MNQILEYNSGKSMGGKTATNKSGSDKVVKVFAIFLILFALCLIGVGVYGKLNNNSTKVASGDSTNATQATIEFETTDDEVTIKVSHDKVIDSLSYKWDVEDKEKSISGEGKSYMEITIPLPSGKHTLEVSVLDSDNKTTTQSQDFVAVNGTDIVAPSIDVDFGYDRVNNKILITAKDETEMKSLTYSWNGQDTVTVEMEEDAEDKTVLTAIADVTEGENSLTVVAVDAANNSSTDNKSVTGKTVPTIEANVNEDKTKVEISCHHSSGFKQIVVTLNGTEKDITDVVDASQVDVVFNLNLIENSENDVKISCVSNDDTKKEEEFPIDTRDEAETLETETPEIKLELTTETDENNEAKMNVVTQYSEGIKQIKVTINGTEANINGLTEGTTDEIKFSIPLADGNNKVSVTTIGVDDNQETRELEANVE